MNSDYVYIYSVNGKLAGEMIRILLESMNIPTIVSQESAGIIYGLTVGPLGEVKIFVPADRVDEAKEILQAMEKGEMNSQIYPGQFPYYPKYKSNKQKPQEVIKDL